MTDYSQLIPLVRRKTGFPQPETGGDDKLSDAEIIEYLNNAFDQMCDAIYGFDRYVEFTITAGGVIAVTDPTTAAEQPVVAATADPVLGSYPVYTISDARSYEMVENKTAAIADTLDRILLSRPLDSRVMQGIYGSEATYYRYSIIHGTRGFTLLPLTITETNTIGITYRRKFVRFAVTDAVMIAGDAARDLLVRNAAKNFTGNDGSAKHFVVQIVNGDPVDPNTFRWSNDGGATYSLPVAVTANIAQTLEDGFTITFPATTGQIANDAWEWYATAPLMTPMEEEEQRGFPVLRAAAECGRDVDETRYYYWLQECLGKKWPEEIGGLLGAFCEKRLTEDLTLDDTLADPYATGAYLL